MDTIIVGAGMAGLSCATALREHGVDCLLFDKGRGPGGRMATRRVDLDGGRLHFDHGAQYFTAREEGFREAVERWQKAGVVARWDIAGEDAWVGAPAMNAPIKAMAETQDVRWGTRVENLLREDHGWSVSDGEETHRCERLVLAIPPEQTAVLLADTAPDLAKRAADVQSLPCWAAMAAFAKPLEIDSDIHRDDDGPISWAARNSAKPGRSGPESWVIHASPERSREILDLSREEAAEILLREFFVETDSEAQEPTYLTAHRWLYAMPEVQEQVPGIWKAELGLGLAGDWLHSPRVEGAWLSGKALADAILAG